MIILSSTFADREYKLYTYLDRDLILNQRAKKCWCILIPMTGIEQSFSYFYWGTGRNLVRKQTLMMSFSLCSDIPGSLYPNRWECSLCREDSPCQSVSEGPWNPGCYSEYSGCWSGEAEQKICELIHLKNVATEIIDDWSGLLKAIYLCAICPL